MSNLSTEHRKLAAIMFTDMVGYSALSQRNEALGLELLEEHRQLLRAVFPRHQGQEIKSTGDGFLVEFASALAAVQCAVEIQRLLRERNHGRSAERRVLVRIGIHLGDVVRRENDVFGDGVNIAARIEPLAEPGGICVSRAVYEQIENKVEHALVQLGKPALKNIQATVEVYRLLLDESRAGRPRRADSRPRILVGGLVAVLAVIGVVVAVKLRPRSDAPELNTASPAGSDPKSAIQVEFTALHQFGPTNAEGVNGWGVVTLGADGFLYGCAALRGPLGGGSIYRVRTNGSDYAVLHSFDRARDGAEPTGGVIEGPDGALYGTTFRAGKEGAGTVFRITKDGSDFRVLHHFASTNDCRHPQSELLVGRDGLLYGTATSGGGHGLGGVFRLAPDGTGYRVITGFRRGQPDDPKRPVGGLIQLPEGVFCGTTKEGGLKDNGTIFRLDANGTLSVVKSLGLAAGGIMQPEGTLLLASDGLLYGTCTLGGVAGGGAVFRLAPDGTGFTVIYNFGTIVDDARQPSAGLVEAADGSLLGTAFAGGSANLGAVFQVSKDGRDYRTLRHFVGGIGDGVRSRSRLTPGAPGWFYSATLSGGRNGLGVVYQLTVPSVVKTSTVTNQPTFPASR
jgi:uncharacterized repeat protein (TIGR03803 family)